MSCEMIAKELLQKYELIRCSVFEDNEWKQKDRKETIKEIVHDKFQLIDEKYEEVKDDFDYNKTEIYKSYKERVKKKDRVDSIFEDTENIILQHN